MSAQAGQKRRRPDSNSNTKRPRLSHRRRQSSFHELSCQVCTLMLSQQGLQHLNSPNGFLHQNRTGCAASADQRCGMCKLILFAVCKEHDEDWNYEDRLLFRNSRDARSPLTTSKGDSAGINNLQGAFESSPTVVVFTVQLFAKQGDPMAKVVRRRPLRRDVQSNKVFAAAKGLIKKCMSPKNPHKHCQYSRDTVLPLRVLDVGEPEDPRSTVKAKVNEIPQRVLDVDKPEDPPSTVKAKVNEIKRLTFNVDNPEDPHSMVRLKVNETDTHAPYLALSYCWGKQPTSVRKKPLQLRKDNIESLKEGIKLHDLQQSIQDAIFATRKLGYRYLWVDALCIIQDCETDKGREIGRMASIYKNASITIAAATSSNAAHGFLSEKPRPYCPQYEVHVRMADDTTGTVYLPTEPYEPDHPLDKRGWTLQEFMLSSRMLIFSDYELLWQCKEIDLCSVSAKGLEYLQPLETLPWTVFDDDAEPYYGNLDSDKVYLWKTIVQQYTDRQLSYNGDKLNAIMGITSELETLWRDTNIYGLWKKWFIELLAWYKPEMEREEQRHFDRAPSWSWASLDGVILYEGSLTTEDAKLKSLTVQAAELSCRILRESDVTAEKARTIAERPDLLDPVAELQQNGLKHGILEYLLLGTVKLDQDTEEGVGLLVIDNGRGVHQRLGFVKFHDMTIWEGVQRRGVILDSRVDKKKENKEGKKRENKEGKKKENKEGKKKENKEGKKREKNKT